ncbi:MAG: cytochrome c, partial [Verrucomicrobiota bacterium]
IRLPNSNGKKLSEYFFCADCHSSEREQSLLSDSPSAAELLHFAHEKELPLLPGPTFAGITNRDAFFESEMATSLDSPSGVNSSLEKAVQFCSTTLAQGRQLNALEMQSVLAYLHSLEWRVGDLGFRGADLAELKRRSLNPREYRSIRDDLRKRFPTRAKSTQGELPADSGSGYASRATRDPKRGDLVWSRACLHCHGAEGASPHFFGDRDSTWEKLQRLFEDGTVYLHIREGSKRESGVHMPPYPDEKLGEQEIEDLRAFIELQAGSPNQPQAPSQAPD